MNWTERTTNRLARTRVSESEEQGWLQEAKWEFSENIDTEKGEEISL